MAAHNFAVVKGRPGIHGLARGLLRSAHEHRRLCWIDSDGRGGLGVMSACLVPASNSAIVTSDTASEEYLGQPEAEGAGPL